VNLSVSPPIRIVAVLGLLLAVAAALFSYTQGRSADDATTPAAPIVKASAASLPNGPIAAATEVAAAANSRAADTAAEGTAAKPAPAPPAAPAAKPTPKPAPVPQDTPKPAPVAPASGLPASIDAALAANNVVVVSLYVPGSRVDEIATAEARAGAQLVGAGFVALNVFDETSSRLLLVKLGMLEGPSVLVFKRPGEVAIHMSGFADRETVAQAAASAAA